MAEQQKKQKGAPRSAGKRKGKIAAYYKMVLPLKKARRILKQHGEAALRRWVNEDPAKFSDRLNAEVRLMKEMRKRAA